MTSGAPYQRPAADQQDPEERGGHAEEDRAFNDCERQGRQMMQTQDESDDRTDKTT